MGNWNRDIINCVPITCDPLVYSDDMVEKHIEAIPFKDENAFLTKMDLSCKEEAHEFDFGKQLAPTDDVIHTIKFKCEQE